MHITLSHIVSDPKLGHFRGLDFFSINKSELLSTESTTAIYHRTGNAKIILPSLPNRIFWNFSQTPHFHLAAIAISHSSDTQLGHPMVWIFFPQTLTGFAFITVGTYPRTCSMSAISQITHCVRHLIGSPSSGSPQNRVVLIFWNFLPHHGLHIALSDPLLNWVSSDGLDFFPKNKPELLSTESTIGTYPRTGNA